GYYNVELKYNFEYTLVFKRPDGSIICEENAVSTHSCRQTLFGSIGTEATISTDLFAEHLGGPMTFSSDPYIMVEAKAVALGAEIRRGCSHNPDGSHRPRTVGVTIGLFGIIKLYRIVSLLVESRGFSIAPECDGCAPPNACDFFDTIDFPMDAFSPPQKPEFTGGISENIPRTVSE
ncbi:MAG: hypothetical protein FWB71_04265, partial [Defluviitaleaceae bacterium]|nr:hypothetical protein [Defluviitaleaceae bacterium]